MKRRYNKLEYRERHSHHTEKTYVVNGYFIKCIQNKYDACLEKENEYGIQVWLITADKVFENCLSNDWYNNEEEANKRFKEVKEMCY